NHSSSRPRNTGRSQVLLSRPPPGSATAFRTGARTLRGHAQPARRGILAFFTPLTLWTFAGTTTSHGHTRSCLLAGKFGHSVRRLRSENRPQSYAPGGVGCRPDRRFGVIIYRRLRSSFG